MKRGLIVINGYFENASSAAQWQGIKAALEARGAAVDVKKSNEISLGIRGEGVFAELPAYDFCVFLDKDVTAALMLEKLGMKLFNGAEAIRLCDDKMLTYAALAGRGIPMPETIASPLMYRENEDDAFLNRVSARLGFPVVVKKCYGSMGQGDSSQKTAGSSANFSPTCGSFRISIRNSRAKAGKTCASSPSAENFSPRSAA